MPDLLAKKKNENKKCFSIEFLVKIKRDPSMSSIVANVLTAILGYIKEEHIIWCRLTCYLCLYIIVI